MMAVSRFNSRRKVPLPLDAHEKDKEVCGFYRSIVRTHPPLYCPVFPDWNQLRHVSFFKLTDDGSCGLEAEDVWTDYNRQKHRVQASISHPVGTQPTDLPPLMRHGYQLNLQKDPPMSMYLHSHNSPWPKKEANIPPARFPRGEYYSYYHDAFHSSRLLHHRLLPFPQRIQPHEVPRVTDLVSCKDRHYDVADHSGAGLSPYNGYP